MRQAPPNSRLLSESCALGAAVLLRLFARIGWPLAGGEYGAAALNRYKYLLFTGSKRAAYAAVPSGILPAVSLLSWRKQDNLSRALTFVTGAYFAFFYLKAFVSLHRFAPAMLLPIVVLWRHPSVESLRRPVALGAAAAAGVTTLAVSLPENPRPESAGRQFGSAIEARAGAYGKCELPVFRRGELLARVAP